MYYSILKHIKCPNTGHYNYKGRFEYSDMETLCKTLITNGKWDETPKADLPLIAMTSFNYNIRADKANPTFLFALDFDDAGNDITIAEEFFKDNAFFLYTTYSHTEQHHKFRVIIVLDDVIHNNEDSHMVFKILENRLKQVGLTLDTACKDISRRFFLPAYDKNGNVPTMTFNEGNLIEIKNDLDIAREEKSLEDKRREELIALNRFNSMFKSKPKIGVEKKIEDAKDKFLCDSGHQQLGKLIGTLLFWEMDKSDIRDWVMMNYRPTSGNVREEYNNWMRWHEGKNNLTYSQKY